MLYLLIVSNRRKEFKINLSTCPRTKPCETVVFEPVEFTNIFFKKKKLETHVFVFADYASPVFILNYILIFFIFLIEELCVNVSLGRDSIWVAVF